MDSNNIFDTSCNMLMKELPPRFFIERFESKDCDLHYKIIYRTFVVDVRLRNNEYKVLVFKQGKSIAKHKTRHLADCLQTIISYTRKRYKREMDISMVFKRRAIF